MDFSRRLDRAERINDLTATLDGWLASMEAEDPVPSPEFVEEITAKITAIGDPSLDALLQEMGTDFHSLLHALEVALWQPPG
jgi:hypothetical protein